MTRTLQGMRHEHRPLTAGAQIPGNTTPTRSTRLRVVNRQGDPKTMRNIIRYTALTLAISLPASADVTLTGSSSVKGGLLSGEGAATTYIKGTKMRTDQVVRGDMMSTIFDVAGQKMITVNHKKKEAEVFEMASFQKVMTGIDETAVGVKFAPNGESKTIAGEKCDGYTMTITIPFKQEGMPDGLSMLMTGPVFISKTSPAKDEYAAFYAKAIENGYFFTAPAQAKAQPSMAKGFATLYREIARAGVAYETTVQIKFEGGGMMGSMMNKMAGMSMTTTFNTVSSDTIADAQFEVPAGYKVKQGK